MPIPLLIPETVILPLGTDIDEAGFIPETATAPIVGNGALGSIVHALVPAVDIGHAGGEVVTVAAYALESTPVGFSVAHCCFKLLKSGLIGVGMPDRVKLNSH